MDKRWKPISRDSQRNVQILIHPSASIADVRRGLATDGIDLSEFVRSASHTAFDARVSLVFNRELFGDIQPKPYQILEFQLKQANEWKVLWAGHIDSIDSFTLSRGERSMQLIAKTRDQQDLWKNVERTTPLFPQLTNLTNIAQTIARACDLKGDEIAFPPSAIMTAHSNTQLANMNAWDMISSIFVALGWTPFIDVQGNLRAADRNIQDRSSDIVLSDDRIVKLGGQRLRPPVSRVRVSWLNPQLVRWEQQARMLTSISVTIGWYLKYHTEKISFSEDGTLRAIETKFVANPGVEKWHKTDWCKVTWTQQSETGGKLFFDNKTNFELYMILLGAWIGTGFIDFIPIVGDIVEGSAQFAFFVSLLKMGAGVYEIWGKPFEYVHALNISEAFDDSVPEWVNNTTEIRCDFVTNEQHGRAIAIRELIFSSASASKWSVSLVDDPRIEYGDLLEFPDGNRLFVEDFDRDVTRGSEAVLNVKGFLIGALPKRGKVCAMPAGVVLVGGYGPDDAKYVFMSPDGKKFYNQPASFAVPGTAFSTFFRTTQGHIGVIGGNSPTFGISGSGLLNRCSLSKQCEFDDRTGVPPGDTFRSGGNMGAADGRGFWYTMIIGGTAASGSQGTGGMLLVTRLNTKGLPVAKWDIPLPAAYAVVLSFGTAAAVSDDGKTLYAWLRKIIPTGPHTPDIFWEVVGQFSLIGTGKFIKFFPNETTNCFSPGYGSLMMAPESNDLIVAYTTPSGWITGMPLADGSIKRYKPNGTVVWTARTPNRIGVLSWNGLALGLPGDDHFLAWAYDEGLNPSHIAGAGQTPSEARYCWFSYATGRPDNSRNFTPVFGDYEFDSQFVVIAPDGGGGLVGDSGGDSGGGGGGGIGGGGGSGGTPSTPVLPDIPSDNGIVDGKLVDPKNYFFSLVNGRAANDGAWVGIMKEIAGAWYAYGQGQQNSSGGEPRGRLFLTHAGCLNVAPRTPEEVFLGVRQDTSVAWESVVDVVLPDGQSWTWNASGPAFVTPAL